MADIGLSERQLAVVLGIPYWQARLATGSVARENDAPVLTADQEAWLAAKALACRALAAAREVIDRELQPPKGKRA